MNTTNTKTRTITIHKKDIFYSEDFLTLFFSEVSGGQSASVRDHIAMDTEESGQQREARRLCDHRVSALREALHKFIDSTTASTADNTLSNSDWVFNLRLSTECEDNILEPIADLMHEYIICGALSDWYAHLGVANNRESLQNRADAALARIRSLIYYKPMP